jgi:hypothetical protein
MRLKKEIRMRYTIIIFVFVLLFLMGCKNNDNPVSSQSQNLKITNIGWIYTNHPSDINGGHLDLDIILHYSGASLQPNEISYFKMTAAGGTWTPPITSTNLLDSLSEIVQAFYSSSLSSNASVMPIGSYGFELKLTDGTDVSQTIVFPAPGSSSTNGYSFIYTEDYTGGTTGSFARMIRRPTFNSVTKVNDTITATFTNSDTLFYNGYIWFYNSSGSYIGGLPWFRNITTKALSNVINKGVTIYSDGMTHNVVKFTQQNCVIYSPASFNDIYSMRIIVTDGIQYQNNPGRSYDCRAVSLSQHL